MAKQVFKLQRTSPKNGMSAYKVDNTRKSGTIYVDAKVFGGNHPDTLEIDGPDEPAAEVDAAVTESGIAESADAPAEPVAE